MRDAGTNLPVSNPLIHGSGYLICRGSVNFGLQVVEKEYREVRYQDMKKGRWCIAHNIRVQTEVTNAKHEGPRVCRSMSSHRAIGDVDSQLSSFSRDYGFEGLQTILVVTLV